MKTNLRCCLKHETKELNLIGCCPQNRCTKSNLKKVIRTWQRSSVRRGDSPRVVHPSKESQLRSVCRGMLVPLMPPPARPNGRTPVGGLRLLGGAQVVEVPTVWAGADGAVQAHGALARLLGLALACPHVQTWDKSQWWVKMQHLKIPKDAFLDATSRPMNCEKCSFAILLDCWVILKVILCLNNFYELVLKY